jgi:hypothetical protein
MHLMLVGVDHEVPVPFADCEFVIISTDPVYSGGRGSRVDGNGRTSSLVHAEQTGRQFSTN